MDNKNNLIDPRHEGVRSTMRIVGPAIAGVGLLLMIIGIGSFFASFGSMDPPRFFWCAFAGMPLLFVGGVISQYAFLGALTRYTAGEMAPVGKDFTNYMVDGTKDAIRDVASAVGQGFSSGPAGTAEQALACQKCGVENEAGANFCHACGSPIARTKRCEKCGDMNPIESRYCDKCGAPA